MTDRPRLAILFNETNEAPKLIKGIRRLRPEAEIVAILSPRAPRQDIENEVDELIILELSPLRLLFTGGFPGLIRGLRKENFHTFVIRYNTLKLKLLTAWISPQKAELWLSHGTVTAIEKSTFSVLKDHFSRKFTGWIRFLTNLCRVLFTRVK